MENDHTHQWRQLIIGMAPVVKVRPDYAMFFCQICLQQQAEVIAWPPTEQILPYLPEQRQQEISEKLAAWRERNPEKATA